MSVPHNLYLRRNENFLDKLYRKHHQSHPTILNNYLKSSATAHQKYFFQIIKKKYFLGIQKISLKMKSIVPNRKLLQTEAKVLTIKTRWPFLKIK